VLSFGLNANCSTTAMAPGDVCTATAQVRNTGEGDYTLSAPTFVSITGPLTECGDGTHFAAQITNLAYTPDVTVIAIGATTTFDVIMSLELEAPNPCQAQSAHIIVTISALATDDGSTPTPAPTRTPIIVDDDDPTPSATATRVIETGGVATTATPTSTPRLISESLPSRFPVTGQGDSLSQGAARAVELLFIGTGLLGGGILLLAIALHSHRKRGAE
jgi:hypothetical protein